MVPPDSRLTTDRTAVRPQIIFLVSMRHLSRGDAGSRFNAPAPHAVAVNIAEGAAVTNCGFIIPGI
jgi:hypothetical protein